ncbi:dihydrodipicolinate synthase family protein [Parapedobacter tibetensis]|uniref:dihydrodipicolinate synthase family protein n=1 Tax=Parapedobacter tibetensis TaxID=2972951 RepID=UPI00214D28CC|nr:dihydrodipicolinate synthase family protein [Parapedobacter tibetensis]
MTKIEGLIAATFSTFHEDGSLNLDIIPTMVDKLVADGLKGIFICGTNGEGPSLTIAERMAVAEAYIKAATDRLTVMVHVGHSSIQESRKLARHAEASGADAISSVAAFYFKPTSVANLVESMVDIAAEAPNTPFYYYHIPALTGVGMDMVEFLTLAEKQIPTLYGIKYTASTLHEYQACLNYKNGKFDILFGYDELLLSALVIGARGAVGSTYNYAAPLYQQVMAYFADGELEKAKDTQFKLVEMVRVLMKFSPIPAQKAVMKARGIDMGPCRLPLKGLTPIETEAFIAMLTETDFFSLLDSTSPIHR